MRNEFEDAFKTSMNTLRFSPEDKKRITEKIIQTHTEQRRINMNKWTLPKAAAIAATCLLVTGGTVFAASKRIKDHYVHSFIQRKLRLFFCYRNEFCHIRPSGKC